MERQTPKPCSGDAVYRIRETPVRFTGASFLSVHAITFHIPSHF